MTRVLVVGGGAAGMSAASVIRRRDADTEVVVVEGGSTISFSACGMPYWIAGIVKGDADALVVVSPEDARKKRGIDVRVKTRVVEVDHDARTAVVSSEAGEDELAYDRLILAPGTAPHIPFETREAKGVFALRHLDDGVALRAFMESRKPERAVVVGGGFVGLEMAEAFVERGLKTTLIHSRDILVSDLLDPDLGRQVNEAVEAAGVHLVTGVQASGVSSDDAGTTVTAGGESYDADIVVLGLGAAPRSELATSIGCKAGPAGTIATDALMHTGVQDVWACGDAVAVTHRVTGKLAFVPLALHANRMGRIAGGNAMGGREEFPGVLGTTITRFGELELAATGLSETAAAEAGFDASAATIKSGSKAIYFPGTQKIQARLVVERGTRRVLGAQIVGGRQTAKRIDTMVAAIWSGATAHDVEAYDLAYAPPFNPVWDAWAIAARMATREA